MRAAAGIFLVLAAAAGAVEPQTEITSQKVHVMEKGQSVVFTGNVVLTRGTDRLTADRLVTQDKNSIARAWGHVELQRRTADGIWEARGEEGVYDMSKSSGTLWGKRKPAQATRRPLAGEDSRVNLTARRLTFFQDAARLAPEKVVMAAAEGSVHIWTEEGLAPPRRTDLWADRADYDGAEDRLVLRGAYGGGATPPPVPSLRPFARQSQGPDRRDLAGETISYFPGDQRLAVEERVEGLFVFQRRPEWQDMERQKSEREIAPAR